MLTHLATENIPLNPKDYFVCTRISMLHLELFGGLGTSSVIGKVTFAKDFGDFHKSGPNYQWYKGKRGEQNFKYEIFKPVNQFS